MTDVNELHELRSRLDEAEKVAAAKSLFFATMSHEIREPMNGVLGMTRLLMETPLSPEQRAFVEGVLDSGEALLTIINDILDLSRIEAGRPALDAIDFDPRSLIERTTRPLCQRAIDKGLALGVEVDGMLPAMLRGDPGRLRQILTNLLGNAIKFTAEGEVRLEVMVSAAEADRCRVEIAVSDTGIGIPDHAIPGLFTPFAQADPSVPRLFGGSGLGLTICHRLVELMGGDIRVESEVGRGTTFRFDLALEIASQQPTPAIAREVAGMTILIVDPNPTTRETLRQQLTGWRVEVEGTVSGEEALRILKDRRGKPFDVVLIDGYLSDMGGEELGRRIRADPALDGLSLVMLASSGLRGDAARVGAIGFAAYLPKPLTSATLLDCLFQLQGPTADHPEQAAGLITVHSMSERRRPPLRILLADDNPVNCRLAMVMLEKAGHRIDVVGDGGAAVSAIEAQPYDLVLMDVQMPGVDGLEATRRIRAMADERRGTPILAITANAMRGDDRLCLDAGMDDYLSKPIDRAGLLAKVARWGYGRSA